MPHRFLLLPESLWAGGGPRRSIHHNAFAAEHLLDAEDMVAVTHGQAGMHAVHIHDRCDATCRFGCIGALGFSDELAVRNAKRLQVFAAYYAFTEPRIVARAAGNDHHGRQAAMVELRCMIQPRFVNRRRPTRSEERRVGKECRSRWSPY